MIILNINELYYYVGNNPRTVCVLKIHKSVKHCSKNVTVISFQKTIGMFFIHIFFFYMFCVFLLAIQPVNSANSGPILRGHLLNALAKYLTDAVQCNTYSVKWGKKLNNQKSNKLNK